MRRNLFWLTDEQWTKIALLLPTDVRGKPRVDDRRVISGILHVRKVDVGGAIVRPNTVPPRQSTIAECGGRNAACRKGCLRESSRQGRSTETQMSAANNATVR